MLGSAWGRHLTEKRNILNVWFIDLKELQRLREIKANILEALVNTYCVDLVRKWFVKSCNSKVHRGVRRIMVISFSSLFFLIPGD